MIMQKNSLVSLTILLSHTIAAATSDSPLCDLCSHSSLCGLFIYISKTNTKHNAALRARAPPGSSRAPGAPRPSASPPAGFRSALALLERRPVPHAHLRPDAHPHHPRLETARLMWGRVQRMRALLDLWRLVRRHCRTPRPQHLVRRPETTLDGWTSVGITRTPESRLQARAMMCCPMI